MFGVGARENLNEEGNYQLIVFLQTVSNLFLVIHDLLEIVFDENPAVNAQDECRGVVLVIIIEDRIDVLWRHRIPLVFGTELKMNVIFGRATPDALNLEDVVFAVYLAPPFPFNTLHSRSILNLNYFIG